MQKKLLSILAVSLMSVVFYCNPENPDTNSCSAINDPTADKYIQITNPSEGDTLQVGQKISIQFKFQNVGSLKSSINSMAILRVGKTDYTITAPNAIPFNSTGTYTCAEIPWTVGFGTIVPPDNENPVKATLRVFQYNEETTYKHSRNIYIKK
jgi:hypothetical protein